jgi:hypothetical protein
MEGTVARFCRLQPQRLQSGTALTILVIDDLRTMRRITIPSTVFGIIRQSVGQLTPSSAPGAGPSAHVDLPVLS